MDVIPILSDVYYISVHCMSCDHILLIQCIYSGCHITLLCLSECHITIDVGTIHLSVHYIIIFRLITTPGIHDLWYDS